MYNEPNTFNWHFEKLDTGNYPTLEKLEDILMIPNYIRGIPIDFSWNVILEYPSAINLLIHPATEYLAVH